MAKVSCNLHHWGVQLILAYSWTRPAILVAGKGRGGMFLFLLFLHFHSFSSLFPVPLFHLLYYLFYLFSVFLWETTQNDPQRADVSLNPNTINQIFKIAGKTCSKIATQQGQTWTNLSPDRIARLILHILFLENCKSFTLTLILPGRGSGDGGWGVHSAKFSSNQRWITSVKRLGDNEVLNSYHLNFKSVT